MSADDYANLAGGYFKTHAFYEKASSIKSIASATSSRSSAATNLATPNAKPCARGINSVQIFYDQNRWWILSVLWDEESQPAPSQQTSPLAQPHPSPN
jgi:hypothetical protein